MPTTLPAPGYISNAARTEGEMKTSLDEIVARIKEIAPAREAEFFTDAGDGIGRRDTNCVLYGYAGCIQGSQREHRGYDS